MAKRRAPTVRNVLEKSYKEALGSPATGLEKVQYYLNDWVKREGGLKSRLPMGSPTKLEGINVVGLQLMEALAIGGLFFFL